ncbi:MAG: cation diffusion facilitator family transporter [Anaerolineae bacterium]
MKLVREASPDPERRKKLRQALWITVLGNLALAVGKGAVSYFTGSVALYADAANSASDVFYSALMVLGMWMAQRPPDMSHPQGHSRFEPLAGLVVAAAMTIAGYEAGRASIVRFLEGGQAVTLGWPTAALLISALVKVAMYALIHRIASAISSSTLDAAATDNLTDVLSSTAALVGTLGSRFVHPLADPIAGGLVAIWILRAAFGVWRENLRYLTGAGASPELRAEIVSQAASVDGVERVHQVITDHVGPELVVDLHINVEGTMTLLDAHRISDEVQGRLEEIPGVDRAYVHVEPCENLSQEAEQKVGPDGTSSDSGTV